MLIITAETIPNRNYIPLSMVQGSIVQSKNIFSDMFAGLQNLVGGELTNYTELINSARKQAIQRMVSEAEQKGADAIIAVRYASSEITTGAVELIVYGTAIQFQ